MSTGAYIFAVCGEREHLDRAVRAARCLRRYTRRRIVILTDPERNSTSINWPDRIDLRVDAIAPTANPAAAAILLKTSVADVLATEGPHAYLDSDVLAISPEVDRIFDAHVAPVTFASDLPFAGANLRTFSSHAIDCPCAVERRRLQSFFVELDSLTAFHRDQNDFAALADPDLYSASSFAGDRRRGKWWNGEATGGRSDGSVGYLQQFREGMPVRIEYRFQGSDWKLVREGAESRWIGPQANVWSWIAAPALVHGGYWEDSRGDSLRVEREGAGERRCWFQARKPARHWRVDARHEAGGAWVDSHGAELGVCDHLREQLESLFGLSISDPRWVPWNGGVFLFDGSARPFLADWRERCLRLFDTGAAEPRDQGALVATVWAHRLENHPRLPTSFNRLVDRRSPRAATLSLAAARKDGARFLHLIGGGIDDSSWPMGHDLAADPAE